MKLKNNSAFFAAILLVAAASAAWGEPGAATQPAGVLPPATAGVRTSATPPPEPSATQAATTATEPLKLPAAGQFLTQAQLVQAYKEKKFPLIVREVRRILADPKVVAGYDPFNLQVLRAESYLGLKNFTAAGDTFIVAAKLAPTEEKKDIMAVTAGLIHNRKGLQYVPKTAAGRREAAKGTGIDLADLSQRESAYRAYFLDELDGAKQGIKNLQSLNAVAGILAQIDDISVLETVASGSQGETQKLKADAAPAIEAALANTLQDKTRLVNAANVEAHKMVTVTDTISRDSRTIQRQKGFDAATVKMLQDVMASMDKIPGSVDTVTKRLGTDPRLFNASVERGAALRDSTKKILDNAASAGLLR